MCLITILYLWKDSNNWNDDNENEVDADEGLVCIARLLNGVCDYSILQIAYIIHVCEHSYIYIYTHIYKKNSRKFIVTIPVRNPW